MQLKQYYNLFKIFQSGIGTKNALKATLDAGKTSISSFLSTTTGQVTAATATFALMYAGIQKLSDKYNLSYDSAIKNTKESVSSLEGTKQEIDSLNSKADQYKEKLSSIGKNYEIDLSGKKSISEMVSTLQDLQKTGKINLSLVDQTEIEKIQTANSELERTKKLKENLLESEQIEAAENAKDSLKRGKQSVAKQVEKTVPGADKRGTPAWAVSNVSVTKAITEDVEAIEKYQDEISKLEKKQSGYKPDSKKYKNAQKDIDSYRDAIEKLQKDLSSKQTDASDLLKAFSKDGTGSSAASKYKKEFKEVKDALDSIAEMDMTPTQKKLSKLDDFFNSSSNSGIRDALLEAAKNGENVNDVLGRMGLKLKDIGKGVSADDLTKYFDDIKKSAEDASDAVDDVNNSLTMSDISEAFESKNAGDDYVSLSDYLTKAKDLYDKGLTGTDDFKSVAEAISYNVDSSTETFKKNYDKLQRYFTKDNDGNLTAGGVSNFLNDLKSLNKGYAEFDENTGKWQLNMSNTAQAAKDMGMSVQVFEAMLGRIQDYDNVGDFKFESAIKQFNDAKDALSELNELYDSMDDGENKKALKANLDKWTPQIENAENDLASLPKEVVTQLKFEYSRQELMKKAQDAMDAAKNSGWNDVTTNATAITANDKAKTKMVSTIDMSKMQEKIPVYFDAENAIQNLQAQLASGNLSEKQTVKVQAEVANLQSLQNEILSAFHDAHPEITAETNTDQATKTFQDWVASAEGQEVITKVTGDNKDALEKINELVDKDYATNVDVNVNDEATPALSDLLNTLYTIPTDLTTELLASDKASPLAIELASNLSGIPKETLTSINATDGASGVLAAIISKITGLPPEVITNLLANDNASAVASMVTNNINGVPNNHRSLLSATDNASGKANSVTSAINNIPSSKKSTITIETIKRTVNEVVSKAGSVKHANGGSIAGGAMQLNGTAHVSGTVIPKLSRRALAMGTLKDDSWLNPQWMTTKDEVALTGEKNEELVVNPRLNRWYTVGTNGAEFAHIPAGSVVFNSRQTKELLSKGYTNSRAKGTPNLSSLPALLNGTAYLGSSTGGFSFSGGASKYNKSSSKRSSTKKPKPSKSSTKSSSGSNTKSNSNSKSSDSAEKSEELLDWIETLLSRTSRLTELATSAVDRAVGLANKQNALVDAVTKTQNEITTNQNAANKYFAQANSLGLAQGYVDKIKNGTLDIESITDDNLKEKISKYKDYYEKGLSAQDKVLDLQDKLNELYQKRLEIIEKEYDTIVEVNDSLKDMFDAKISYNSAYGMANDNQDNIDSINKSIKAQEDTFNQLTKKFDEYQKEVNSQIASGVLKQGSEDYRSAQKNLNDFTANIYKASQELIELQDKLVQLRVDAIQTIIDTFQRRSDKLDKYSSLLEAKDETVPESVYQERLDNNNDTIRKNQEARAIWLQRQATEDVNSDNYKKYAEEIQKLDESTLDLMKDNEDLKNSIYSLGIKNLEDAIKGYDDLETELKGFRDLLNDDAFLDKKGGITDEGLAQITLLSQSIGNAKQKISDLTTGLQKAKELYDNGVISLKEYNEKSAEYRKELQSSTSDVKSYQKSLTDLYQNALKAEVDALDKVIDKRREAYKQQREYADYQKKVNSQQKDVNSIKAQIQAMENSSDASTLARVKKLKQDLANAEDDLNTTKQNHKDDLISEGFQKLSDDLNQMLEDTEYEISHNADKQNEIIQSMLNKQVGMYQEAYSKINSIIKNTGWVGSNDFNNNQSQMSSQTGAQNQASNASQSQSQANKNPSSSASGTDTSGIKDNASENNKITENIMKPENTTNRPVAELKVSSSSVSIEEGKSTSVTTKIRPNDAANKTLTWKSSNESVATVSNGTISGKKPGSCQVTVSTTDGSGLSQTIGVTVTKKPDPPKPAPAPVLSGGDGIARVGDVVTFTGSYYYDSWGKKPAGNLYSGVKNGVVIDSYSSKDFGGNAKYTGNLKVHIKSADGRYGNLGWVGLNQISGYATGTLGVDKDQIAVVDENGRELVVPNPKGGRITKLEKGTGVIPNPATEKLVNMTNNLDNNGNMVINGRTIEEYVNDMANMQSIAVPDFSDVTASVVSQLEGKGMGNVTLEYNQPVTFNSVDKNDIPAMEEFLKKSCDYTMKAFAKDLRKKGFRITR